MDEFASIFFPLNISVNSEGVTPIARYAVMVGAGALVGILWGAMVFRKK